MPNDDDLDQGEERPDPDGHRDDGEQPDEPPAQTGGQRQRRRSPLDWQIEGAARLHRQFIQSMRPSYIEFLGQQAQIAAMKAQMQKNWPQINYAKLMATNPTVLNVAEIARQITGAGLTNWPTIQTRAIWPDITKSLRNLVQANLALSVPNIGAWVEQLRLEHYPPNWPDDIRIEDVRMLADDEGIPLCWVPRSEVITALCEADPDRRRDVLIEHRADVLEDCTFRLAEVTAPELAKYASAAGEVLDAMRADLTGPAQAYAMNVMDATLRGTLFNAVPKSRFYNPVVAKVEESRDCYLSELRESATLWPLLRVFDRFHPDRGDDVPSLANRHATAHTVDDVQYTPVNALIAAMLAVSILREVQESTAPTDDPADEVEESTV